METPTLKAYISPSVFSDEAIATAKASDIEALRDSLLILRFWIALCDGQEVDATRALARLRRETHGGWPLYQITTGAVFLAIKKGVEADIIAALDDWLTGMAAFPRNWQVGVLQAPEVVPWLSHFPQNRLVLPLPQKRRRMTRHERAFVRDVNSTIEKAVHANLHWLRELGFSQSIETLIKRYKLTGVDLVLREATIGGSAAIPDIIIALDDSGAFQGAFLAH